jgi:hypothetical protein
MADETPLPPTPPREPDASDCCGEGCINCVYDRYEAALERYRDALSRWRLHAAERGDGGAGA